MSKHVKIRPQLLDELDAIGTGGKKTAAEMRDIDEAVAASRRHVGHRPAAAAPLRRVSR